MVLRLVGIIDRLAVRERKNESAADEKHRQRSNERGYLQDGDEDAVEEADSRAQEHAEDHRCYDAEIEEARCEQPSKDHCHQAIG